MRTSGRCKVEEQSSPFPELYQSNYSAPFNNAKSLITMSSKASPYSGNVINYSPAKSYDFSRSYAIVVSGATWNPCGHLLLNVGGYGGWYFHIAETKGYPRLMDQLGYQRYIHENNKNELSRTFVPLKYPQRSMVKLVELLSRKWSWWLLPNNCASFVEEVLQAGGTTAGLYSNCPAREVFR